MLWVALAALGVAASALVAVIYFARRALAYADGRAADREARARAEGALLAANTETARANDATAVALAAQRRQEHRADMLDKELMDVEANPILLAEPGARPGRQRLREALRRVAALDATTADAGDDGAGGDHEVPGDGPATTPS